MKPPSLSSFLPVPPPVTPSVAQVNVYRKSLALELKDVLVTQQTKIEDKCEMVQPVNIGAVLKKRIETLAFEEKLAQLNIDAKTRFADRFPVDIPHIDDLPDDVYYRIKLRDANQVIQMRGYNCPRKYRESWHTLLQQHPDAGRIQPSSSQHSAPSFIIPKADPMVLPRWVNDFRVLNANIYRAG